MSPKDEKSSSLMDSDKTDGQKLLEAAVLGIALGVAIGAIAHYLSQKNE